MATTKKTTKKTSVEKKPVAKRQTVSRKEDNKKHIFAGFLLGLSVGMLFFAAYLVTMFCV